MATVDKGSYARKEAEPSSISALWLILMSAVRHLGELPQHVASLVEVLGTEPNAIPGAHGAPPRRDHIVR